MFSLAFYTYEHSLLGLLTAFGFKARNLGHPSFNSRFSIEAHQDPGRLNSVVSPETGIMRLFLNLGSAKHYQLPVTALEQNCSQN